MQSHPVVVLRPTTGYALIPPGSQEGDICVPDSRTAQISRLESFSLRGFARVVYADC